MFAGQDVCGNIKPQSKLLVQLDERESVGALSLDSADRWQHYPLKCNRKDRG